MAAFQYGYIPHFISNCKNVTDIMNNEILKVTSNYTIITLMNLCHKEFFTALGSGSDNIKGVLPFFISSISELNAFGNKVYIYIYFSISFNYFSISLFISFFYMFSLKGLV